MRLMPSDPDIQTIVNRINNGDINLQPDFQRGEVWGDGKKIRLIDSILRNWHVPPIHVVEIKETGKQEVLDGQQRLAAIRDFVNGLIKVDGNIEPLNNDIIQLDGLTYEELPDFWRRKFDKFTIRIYNITDYLPSEPGELFYRLNQPTNLTSAEQRNAFYGPSREQVKCIVEMFEEIGLTSKELGFSNSRMAYDDVVARLCVLIEIGRLTEKITATVLADWYRGEKGFSPSTITRVETSIKLLGKSITYVQNNIRFNKATLLSWLIFFSQLQLLPINLDPEYLGQFVYRFEYTRSGKENYFPLEDRLSVFLNIFNDRASSRVADVSSVIIRDFVIWTFFAKFSEGKYMYLSDVRIDTINNFLGSFYDSDEDMQEILVQYLQKYRWGSMI